MQCLFTLTDYTLTCTFISLSSTSQYQELLALLLFKSIRFTSLHVISHKCTNYTHTQAAYVLSHTHAHTHTHLTNSFVQSKSPVVHTENAVPLVDKKKPV